MCFKSKLVVHSHIVLCTEKASVEKKVTSLYQRPHDPPQRHTGVARARTDNPLALKSILAPLNDLAFFANYPRLSLTFKRLPWLYLDSKTKVGEFNVHVVIEKDVLWLQVPVDDVLAVEKLDHLQQSAHDLPDNVTTQHIILIPSLLLSEQTVIL